MKNGVKIALVLAGALAVTGIGMTVGGMAAGAFDEDTPGFEKNRLVQWLRRRTHDVVTVEGSEELPSDPADWEAYRARDEVDWKSFGAEEAIWRVEVEGDVLELEIRNADESLMDDSDGEQETLLPGGAAVRSRWRKGTQPTVDVHVQDGVLYVSVEAGTDGMGENGAPEVTVYLPGGEVSQLAADLDVGTAELEGMLQLDQLDLSVGTGNLELGDDSGAVICIAESAVLNCSMGDVDAGLLECLGDMQIAVNMGDADLTFLTLNGNLSVENGAGDVDVELPFPGTDDWADSLNYSLSTGMGEISCDAWEFYEEHRMSSEETWEHGGEVHGGDSGNHFSDSGVNQDLQLTNNPGGSTITIQSKTGDISVSYLY